MQSKILRERETRERENAREKEREDWGAFGSITKQYEAEFLLSAGLAETTVPQTGTRAVQT